MDIKKMKGKDLFLYVTEIYEDKEFAETVNLMAYALTYDMSKVYSMLEDIIVQGKRLVAVYPGNGDVVPSDAELVGEIPDGALYVM